MQDIIKKLENSDFISIDNVMYRMNGIMYDEDAILAYYIDEDTQEEYVTNIKEMLNYEMKFFSIKEICDWKREFLNEEKRII